MEKFAVHTLGLRSLRFCAKDSTASIMKWTLRWLPRVGWHWSLTIPFLLLAFAGGADDKLGLAVGKPQRPSAADVNPVTTPPVLWLPPPVPMLNATATTEAEMRPYTDVIPGSLVTFDMVPIPSGSFLMGSPNGEAGRSASEDPQRTAKLDAFWMGKCEVTWVEFEQWMNTTGWPRAENPLALVHPKKWSLLDKLSFDVVSFPSEKPFVEMSFGMGKEGYPAINMTQLAAKLYCKWLSAKTGRYYRLPTEAEWEYACRAGTTTTYYFGDDKKELNLFAWSAHNSDYRYHRVGSKKPNPWGLYDMHGNVAEWVLDQFTPEGYGQSSGRTLHNPVVVPRTLHPRVVRGGSWDDEAKELRSAARRGSSPDWQAQDWRIPKSPFWLTDAPFVGFRVVRPLKLPTAKEAMKYDLDPVQQAALAHLRKLYEQQALDAAKP